MHEITKSNYFKFSEKLIALDTVSSKPNGECSALVANELKDLGFETLIEKYDDCHGTKEQVIGIIGPPVEGGLILSGHMDIVPYENQPGWTRDALSLEISDDKLFGRGSCDMKLFIAQCIEAFKGIELEKLKKPIVCIFTTDEEVGCLGAHHLTKKLDTILGKTPLPKRAIIGEPTSFNIVNTHKGIMQFDIIIHGVAGHSSRPDLGKNSIAPLAKIISVINNLNLEFQETLDPVIKKLFPDFPYNYLHMATLKSGIATNMIPEKTVLQISYRTFPLDPPHKVLNHLKARLEMANIDLPYEITTVRSTPAMPLANNQELEILLKEYTQTKELKSVSFATDGGYLSTAGIDCYVCGPGEIEMAHKPNEYMPLQDFIVGPNIIKSILKDLLF
jgi:acetylornithine deacetylase